MLAKFHNANQVLLHNFRTCAGSAALRFKAAGEYRDLTYAELGELARRVASGLLAAGLERGDRVAILAPNCPEWVYAHLGILLAGGIPAALYTTSPPEEVRYILDDLKARFLFVEDQPMLDRVRPALPEMDGFWLMRGGEGLGRMLAEPASEAALEAIHRLASELDREDLLTVIYTSGTTGVPKGACLTHGNYLFSTQSCYDQIEDPGSIRVLLSFLPLAHSFERLAGHFLSLFFGRTVALAESPETLLENFQEVQPHMVTAVPRFFEKVHARIMGTLGPSGWRRQLFFWLHRLKQRRDGLAGGAPGWLRVMAFLVDGLIFSRLRARFGGRLRFFISGGAPLGEELASFFAPLGLPILEGYGMTEATAPCTLNTPSHYRAGSVGRALPGVEVRTASDGELEVRGPNLFAGYWRNPKATDEVMTEDGYYRTGDYGRIDQDGYVWVTERKKHLIVLSTGKNVAPAAVEGKMVGGVIGQAYVHGDRQKYLTALISLDPDIVQRSSSAGPAVEQAIAAANRKLPRHLQVQHYRVLPRPFTVEDGELTPTLKLRREVIRERYAEVLDSLYSSD